MSFSTATVVFVIAVVFMMAGSYMLSRSLDRVGARYGIPLGLLGLITAVAADSPEITSAITALLKGEHEMGIGVVLGSNLFNLAALLGLGAVVANNLAIRRPPLIFHMTTSLLATAAAALLMYRLLSPAWAAVLLAAIFALYSAIVFVEAEQDARPIANRGRTAALWTMWNRLAALLHDRPRQGSFGRRSPGTEHWPGRKLLLTAILSVVAIIGGATYTVQSALIIGSAMAVPRPIIGSLVVAVLSSLPNAYTSAHLARQQDGTAVLAETSSSNTINILFGLTLPALILGWSRPPTFSIVEIWWLLAMTAAALLLPLPRARLSRWCGLVLIAAYLAFIAARMVFI